MASFLLFSVFFVMGTIFGSFACCQAYRICYRNLGKKVGEYSECLACGHRLKWFELIPIISWLWLGGKCRRCGAKIGLIELVSEIGMGVLFSLILVWGLQMAGWTISEMMVTGFGWQFEKILLGLANLPILIRMVLLMTVAVMSWILLVYDMKWQELPSRLLFILIVVAGIYFIVNELVRLGILDAGLGDLKMMGWGRGGLNNGAGKILLNEVQKRELLGRDLLFLGGSILVLPVLYFLLYKISREKLVGGGDYLLTCFMVLFLWRVELAMSLLCLANLLAFACNAKNMLTKQQKRIAFGPYLIVGFWVIFFLSQEILRYFYIVG